MKVEMLPYKKSQTHPGPEPLDILLSLGFPHLVISTTDKYWPHMMILSSDRPTHQYSESPKDRVKLSLLVTTDWATLPLLVVQQ